MTDFAAARRIMVDSQVRTSDVTDPRLIAAKAGLPAIAIALAICLSLSACGEKKIVVPEVFRVKFETSKGDVIVEATRSWAPHGVDRFHELVRMGYFTEGRFFRVVPQFVVQFRGDCGPLMEEQVPGRDQGGAPVESRQERRERGAVVRSWLNEDSSQTIEQLRGRFDLAGVKVSPSAVKNYRREALNVDTDTN